MKKINKKGSWSMETFGKAALMLILVFLGIYIILQIRGNVDKTNTYTACESLPGVNGTCVENKAACDKDGGLFKGEDKSCKEKKDKTTENSLPYCCAIPKS